MDNALFDLEQEKNWLSKEILAVFSTEDPDYLSFIKNWEELNDVKQQLNSDMDFNDEW